MVKEIVIVENYDKNKDVLYDEEATIYLEGFMDNISYINEGTDIRRQSVILKTFG
jgi:hypothetical protein